jgi:hypothetical protein
MAKWPCPRPQSWCAFESKPFSPTPLQGRLLLVRPQGTQGPAFLNSQ